MLCTLPPRGADVEPGGGALADADLEVADRGLEHDRAADDLAEPDVAVGGLGDDAGLRDGRRRCCRWPRLTRRSPPAAPTQVSPLEFLITALPPSSRSADVARAGGDLGVARGALDADVAGAALEVHRAGLVEPDAAEAGLDPALAERGRRRGQSTAASAPCTFEPAGSSIVTSIERRRRAADHWRSFGVLTSSAPPEYSTRVCSAALTSSALEGSLGRTSTTVRAAVAGGDPQVADGRARSWPRSVRGCRMSAWGALLQGQVRRQWLCG